MPTDAKRATVAELREDLAGSTALITTEYRGLTVREIGEIRRDLSDEDDSCTGRNPQPQCGFAALMSCGSDTDGHNRVDRPRTRDEMAVLIDLD